MLGEKFYDNLSSLESNELNNFIRYSKSSFFNKKEEISVTLELFKKNKSHFFNLLKNENLLVEKIFPKTKIPHKKILKELFHSCEKLLEDFIVYYVSKNDKELKLSVLSSFYAEKNNKKEALSQNTKLINIIERNVLSYKNYYKLFKANYDRFYILLNDFSYDTFKHAEKAIEFLDQYYFLEKIVLSKELVTDTIMTNRKYNFRLLEEIVTEIETDIEFSDILIFKLYSQSIELYKEDITLTKLNTFIDLVYTNIDLFDFATKSEFLSDISNFISIFYAKTSDNSLQKLIFENYKQQLKYKTNIKNKNIHDTNFSQIIRVSLFLEEFEWAHKFIEEYGIYLNNKDLLIISSAEIAYNQKKYDLTLSLIHKVELKNTKMNYELKTLYAKVLYDTKELEMLENHLNTFDIYLRRQKELSELVKEKNLKFVLYFKRLLKNQVKPKALLKLQADIENDKGFFNRNWILKRVQNFFL